MFSMTGFGRGEVLLGDKSFRLEVRSLNHRFLDARVRLPWFSADLESRMLKRVRARLTRGRVDVVLAEEPGGSGTSTLQVDEELARQLGQAAARIGELAGVSKEAALAMLPHRPDLLQAGGDTLATDADATWEAVGPALERALDELCAMRATEGEANLKVLAGHREQLLALGKKIAALAAGEPDRLRQRIMTRLGALGENGEDPLSIDPVRLAQEAAMVADRADVAEELDRLASHLDQLGELLHSTGEPLGRKLEFMQQELLRELNTTGSKTQNTEVSHLVVEAKSVLERMREQVQNVE